MTDHYRQQFLAAPNMHFLVGDPVFFRRDARSPEERGRVVGALAARSRVTGRYIYDIEVGHERVSGVTIVRADEDAMREITRLETEADQ